MVKGGTGSGRNAPKLPKQQLTILALCRFAEPVAMTSVCWFRWKGFREWKLTYTGVSLHTGNDQVFQCAFETSCKMGWIALADLFAVASSCWDCLGSSF